MLFSLHRGGERISVLLITRHATHAKRVSTAYKGECTHDMHREGWTGGAHGEGEGEGRKGREYLR